MDKALFGMLFILFLFLIMAPIFIWINNRSNENLEDIDDLSEESLMKLEIKMSLLKMLEQWFKENDLSHEEIAIKLAVSLNIVADIVHQRFDNFTVDSLIGLVLKTGKSIKFVIKK